MSTLRQSEYQVARVSPMPHHQAPDQVVAGVARHFTRLTLPIVDADNNAASMLIASRSFHEPFDLPK